MGATGHCLCGAVTFTAEQIQTNVHSCHCGMCQRWTGGPSFSVSVGSVAFEGQKCISRFISSEWAERGFCNRCGTNLFYRVKEDDQYFLCMGTFDNLKEFTFGDEIYIDQKPAVYDFVGDHPRLTGDEFIASLQQGDG